MILNMERMIYGHNFCAPAVLAVAAVVGTAATVSSTVKQNQAAAAQRSSLKAAQSASALTSQMRGIEIEQQKLFLGAQEQLNNAARAQEYMVQQQQVALQQQQLVQQSQQEYLNLEANNLLTQRQQQSQLVSQDLNTQRQQEQLAQADFTQATEQGINFNTQAQGLAMSDAQGARQNATALRDSMANLENQRIQIREQVGGALEGLSREFSGATKQRKNQLKQEAATLIALSRGQELSTSSRAFLDERASEIDNQALESVLTSDRMAQLLDKSQDYNVGQVQQQIDNAQKGFTSNELMRNLGTETQRNALLSSNQLANLSRQQATAQNQMDIQAQDVLAKMGINQDAFLQLNLNNADTVANLQQIGLDYKAIEQLKQVQANTFTLGNKQANLNAQFGEIALNSQKASVQAAGNAERASLGAQAAGVQSPGAVGLLSNVASGAANIYSIFNQGGGGVSQTNPFS